MSRTYKDIRSEYRDRRRRQISELEGARVVRSLAGERARARQEAARSLGLADGQVAWAPMQRVAA